MKTEKILFVISLVDRSLGFEWFFRELSKTGTDFEIVFLHPSEPELAKFCKSLDIPVAWMRYKNKYDIPTVSFSLFKLMKIRKYTILHAHLFDACLVALTVARMAGIKKRIHTRHHASQHHLYNPHAVKFDRFINSQSTHIVAISKGIKKILVEQEGVAAAKVTVVHHGFDLKYFESVNEVRVAALKEKYRTSKHFPVIGVISRWTHWKGIQFIIPAFELVLKQYPNALLLLANAKGEYVREVEQLLTPLPAPSYRKIIFEPDTPSLYQLMNVFVHVPIDDHSEAFGQVYVEALAAGIPSLFTLSGIANEFITDEKQALVVPYMSADAIADSITRLLNDATLKNTLVTEGRKSVEQLFDIGLMVDKMNRIYEQ